MAVDDVYILTVSAQQLGNLRQNSLAFRATDVTTPTAATFQPIADAMKEAWRLSQHNSVTYTTWKARQVYGTGVTWPTTGTKCAPSGGVFFEGNLSGTLVGAGGTAGALAPQCAFVTTLRTGMIGRSRRGRHFAYGFASSAQVDGIWVSGIVTSMTTGWNSLFTAYAVAAPASGYRLGIWSNRIASGCIVMPNGDHVRDGTGSPATAFTNVTQHVERTTVFTQRRRVTGMGS